ncbi:hypothetical protein GCM10008171_07270 [Methylopila jiangsuensis]|uniref:DUF2948 family protein n=1 Tax=Methylopila jiangsuensis TaxID=586230 RepID=A0A9W6JH76_9HYPH|nr:DUF2948 family protein [Methylopila jiangsuensis]MDR6285714.1 hypothetical protein [Methylopila jiangsuensis]GLK75473.1 hypothetical protein GCM10008171_07270 [Methylopila jiangsuensis]
MTQPSDAPLKLIALDAEDLAVLSAHLQDTALKVRDLVYLPREKRFAFVGDRLDRLGAEPARRRAAAHFDRVTAVRARGVDRSAPDAELTLLVIAFLPADGPSGAIELHFEGGACLRLEVECVEAQAADLGPARAPAPTVGD